MIRRFVILGFTLAMTSGVLMGCDRSGAAGYADRAVEPTPRPQPAPQPRPEPRPGPVNTGDPGDRHAAAAGNAVGELGVAPTK